MTTIDDMRRKFPNRRQWRDFIASVHDTVTLPCAATYPMVMDALRSGRAWLSWGAVRALRLDVRGRASIDPDWNTHCSVLRAGSRPA
jgi:hypothetical protein